MKKIYLHMGFHKTATTSFQKTCKQNKDLLLEQGFEYPLFNSDQMPWKDIENHSFTVFSLFCNRPELFRRNVEAHVFDMDALHKDYLTTLEAAFATVIIPFLSAFKSRDHAAIFNFWAGVMPPMPILGLSLL